MIYWFTGQPGAGKTTLALAFKQYLEKNQELLEGLCYHIDGDDLRAIHSNVDYSIKGRVNNVSTAQSIASYLHSKGDTAIVSLIAPYIDQREDFKRQHKDNIKEIYVHTTEIRGREEYFASSYKEPVENFIEIKTDDITVEESLAELINKIWPPVEEEVEVYVEEEKKKTYFIDIDGTLFKYRKFGTYETQKAEVIESTVDHVRQQHSEGHMIILTTARPETLYEHTLRELTENDIPFDKLIMGIERGARYVVNDKDPNKDDEDRAIAVNVERDKGLL